MPGSADPSPASGGVLCPMPDSASLHHAWLTASAVNSSVCTCANREWRIELAYPKKVVIKISFCKKGCGNVSVHIRKPHEMFLSVVHTKDTVCKTGSVHKLAAHPGTLVFWCWCLHCFPTCPGHSMYNGIVPMVNGNHCKYRMQLENCHHLYKAIAQVHLTFHSLHVQIQARHMDCVLIPTDWGLMGLRRSKQVQMSRLWKSLD